jgi:hypothetical protein
MKRRIIIHALDMFHLVSTPNVFLEELNRVCKERGLLLIDNGHQSKDEARLKLRSSGSWEIVKENKRYLKCSPIRNSKNSPGAIGGDRVCQQSCGLRRSGQWTSGLDSEKDLPVFRVI